MYLVKKPFNGSRSCAEGEGESYILVRTTKITNDFNHDNVQQSDFVRQWNGLNSQENLNTLYSSNFSFKNRIRLYLKSITIIYNIYQIFLKRRGKFVKSHEKIDEMNPSLTKIDVTDLLNAKHFQSPSLQ